MTHMSIMHEPHLGSMDLNLLVALDALLEARNVTRAADKIGITQSAMSHALSRLRTVTGDALLVRGTGGMVPTPRAQALAPPIRRALDEVRVALRAPARFDPKTAHLFVRVGASDYGELILLPRVVRRLEREAPGIDLRVVQHTDPNPGPLSGGALDLVVAPVRPGDEASGMFAVKLFDERFVCVVRHGHPLAKKKLTLALFAAASHVLIAPGGREGSSVNEALARLGMSRHIAVTVPHFLVAPHLVAGSDLVLTVAERVAKLLADPLGLVILTPPAELRLKGFTMSALWHERTHAEPAHVWVRGLFAEIARDLPKDR
jgi:DNA-binding transcriptional LysR family regulator